MLRNEVAVLEIDRKAPFFLPEGFILWGSYLYTMVEISFSIASV